MLISGEEPVEVETSEVETGRFSAEHLDLVNGTGTVSIPSGYTEESSRLTTPAGIITERRGLYSSCHIYSYSNIDIYIYA